MNGTEPAASGKTPVTQDERTWAMIAHLSALAGVLVPLASVIAPLVIWLVKRDQSTFVGDQAKEALNFNITVVIAAAVCYVLMFILVGFLLGALLAVFWLVMVIIAALKANEGVTYRYPVAIRLVT